MCLSDAAIIRAGIWALDDIGDMFGVPIHKALDPLDANDFVTICVRLGSSLRSAVKGTEGAALDSALDTLDVDWVELSAEGRAKIIAAARAEIGALADRVPDVVDPVLSTSAATLVTKTRESAVAEFSFGHQLIHEAPVDREAVTLLPKSQLVYIRDQYGNRADALDRIAKDTVASGLERGLGRTDISEELTTHLEASGVLRTKNYWNLIATDFANKARTVTQLNTFERADIARYRFVAMMDQATSEICRLLNGREFSVKKAAANMREGISATNPEDIRSLSPWVQAGTDADGNSILYYDKGKGRRVVAQVDSPGEGELDRTGTYSGVMSNKQLEAAGVTVPPRHGHCRSTIVTVD